MTADAVSENCHGHVAMRVDAWAVIVEARKHVATIVAELLDGGSRDENWWLAATMSGGAGDGIAVELSGQRAGAWRSRDGLQSGDLVDLVATAPRARCGGDRCAAIRWLAAAIGLPAPPPPGRPAATYIPHQAPSVRSQDPEATRDMVRKIWDECTPLVAGDPVTSYLRGKNISLVRLPPTLRHGLVFNAESNARRPAIVAAIADAAGALAALHVSWIGKAGNRWLDTRLKLPRRIIGDHAGRYIKLNRGASGSPIEQAEMGGMIAIGGGLIMCLATVAACPGLRLVCSINSVNTASIDLPAAIRFVILLKDRNGPRDAVAAHWFQQAIAKFSSEGRAVRVAHAPRPGERAPDAARRIAAE